MANTSLFSSLFARFAPARATNDAGGRAYALGPRHALAQLAVTGTFHNTFYTEGAGQLDRVRSLAAEVDAAFLARLAIYSRQRGAMKDMPAALVAILAARDPALFHTAFDQVVDNGRMLRTLFQMIRSGQFGRRSLSGAVQRAFNRWLNRATPEALLAASVGDRPALRDVLRLARPVPVDNARRAMFGALTDRTPDHWAPAGPADLPAAFRLLAEFRAAETEDAQVALLEQLRVRWDLLASSVRGPRVWAALARSMGPHALRMNLNTLLRHGVFEDPERVAEVAARLGDPDAVRRSRQFPYQYFAAWKNVDAAVPAAVRSALHQAAEVACGNVPVFPGPVVVGVDVSGSMQSAVTGHRGRGATSRMRCVDVAALVAAAILRRNPDSVLVPFDTVAYPVRNDPASSILGIAESLTGLGGGGTDCSRPVAWANDHLAQRRFAGVVLVSDNESWVYRDRPHGVGRNGSTGLLAEWEQFVRVQNRLRSAEDLPPRLVCIDLQPNTTTQAPERDDILNVGGFSDTVFDVIGSFLAGDDGGRLVAEIESVPLPGTG